MPLPLAVTLHRGEPALPLLRRTASLHGLRLRKLCRELGPLRGNPDDWPAARLCSHSTARLGHLLNVPCEELARHIPDLATNSAAHGLERRSAPPGIFGPRQACPQCLSERDGAMRSEWERPWQIGCAIHRTILVEGPVQAITDDLLAAQETISGLVDRYEWETVEEGLATAQHIVHQWRLWENLQDRLVARALAGRPDWAERKVLPALPAVLLLPEAAAVTGALLDTRDLAPPAALSDLTDVATGLLGHTPSDRGLRPIQEVILDRPKSPLAMTK